MGSILEFAIPEELEAAWPTLEPIVPEASDDLEAGLATPPLEIRGSFIRKFYVLAIQILLTVTVGATVVTNDTIVTFLTTNKGGLACYVVIIIIPFVTLGPLCYYRHCRPVKRALFAIFTTSISFGIGLTCAFISEKVMLEVTVLTTMVVVSLTLFAIWVAKRGYKFNFLGMFMVGAIMMSLIFAVFQRFFPLDGISVLLYGCLPVTIFDQLENYGSQTSVELATNSMANPPQLKSNDHFALSYNMTNLKKSISEIHLKIKADKKDILPKQVFTRKEGKGKQPKTIGKGITKIKEYVAKLVPKNQKKQVKTLTCFHCGHSGHIRRNCQSYLEDLKNRNAGQSSTQGY